VALARDENGQSSESNTTLEVALRGRNVEARMTDWQTAAGKPFGCSIPASRSSTVDVFECISTTSILQAGFSRLDRLCESLQDRLEVLELQYRSMEGCLKEAGLLREEDFLAHLHRHSFAATRSRYPFECTSSLADLCLDRDLRYNIGSFAGWSTVRRCSNTHRALRELSSLVPQMLYVIGGFDGHNITSSVERLDPKGCDIWNAWEQAEKPASQPQLGAYLCGTRKETTGPALQALAHMSPGDALKGVWEEVPSMNEKRAGFAATEVSGVLFVCGGYNGRDFLSSVEKYMWTAEHPMGVWKNIDNMSTPRHCPAAAGSQGRLFVCGGYDGVKALASVEEYDTIVGTWRTAPPLSEARHGACASAVADKVLVCGGFNGDEVLRTVECLDLTMGMMWIRIESMAVPRNVASAAVYNGKLYVCGGCNGKESLSSSECYDPNNGRWEQLPNMRSSRHGGAAMVADGQLFVCGGGDNTQAPGQLLGAVERFRLDSKSDSSLPPCRWSSGVPLLLPRGDVAAVSLFTPLRRC